MEQTSAPTYPRTQHLPGVEGAIPALEEAAEAYADIRDQRIELNKNEANLKASVLRLMHDHNKTVYKRGRVTITIVPEAEDVKVRVSKADAAPAGEQDVADDE